MPDTTSTKNALRAQRIETPSWAFGNTGTRFKVFAQPGVPRTPQEKIDDAAQVHAFTGVAPSVAVHIPWDKVDDYGALAAHAKSAGVTIGTVNANVFQDDDYRLGSIANPDPRVRRKALDHLLECVETPGVCVIQPGCTLRRVLAEAERRQMEYLDGVTLASLLPRSGDVATFLTG